MSKDVSNTAPSLAKPGDPIVLPNGGVFDPVPVEEEQERAPIAPTDTMVAKDFRPKRRRTLKELPAPNKMFQGIGVIFAYTVMGVGDIEICDALRITHDDLKKLRDHVAYSELFDTMFSELIDSNSQFIQARLAGYAHTAVSTIGHLAKSGKKEETKLSASKDILDRIGLRAQDQAKQGAAQMQGFRILITDKDKDIEVTLNGQSERV